ncbi:MAG TPA: nucleoside kinase [Clostridiales bacterium]|jgi:uridine kinase|nr:nucleoside kinase [Clostridiales bacterium]
MNIDLKLAPGERAIRVQADKGTIIAELAEQYQEYLPYEIIAARLDNHVVGLDTALQCDAEVTLLDIRDPSGNQAYQNSVVELYLLAVKRVFPDASVIIAHSLNRGIFTKVTGRRAFTPSQVERIKKAMIALSEEDIPFSSINPDLLLVAPSTGYIRTFDLRKCRNGIVILIPEAAHPQGLPPYRDDKKLHRAFEEQEKWNDMLDVRFMEDLTRKIQSGEIKDLIRISEALHEKNIAKIADQIVRSGKRIVLIAGPSSAGKTSFAHRLSTQLWVNDHKPLYLGTDDYFLNRDDVPIGPDGAKDFENLDAVDVQLFNDHLNALLAGEEVDIPRFDFTTGEKVFGERILRAGPEQPLVIEGIHGLNDYLTRLVPAEEKFKIYISPLTQLRIDNHNRIPLTDIRKLRRIIRDASKRGWDARQTIELWPKVRAGEDVNIFPFSDQADAIFNSVHIYELAVLKKYAKPLLEEIGEDEETYTEARRLLRLLGFVEMVEDDSVIVNNSIIREFIGGSVIA